MHISCLGLNHTTAPVALRERLAFSETQAQASLAGLKTSQAPAVEMVILSTCNRIELYMASPEPGLEALETFLEQARSVSPAELRPHLYRLEGVDTVHHLFRVTAGLDSLVLGEPQILGQVTGALLLARQQGVAGPLLNRLFQGAIHAGKRARSETAISRNPASVSSLAASLAERQVKHLPEVQVVVLGAGEMAELAVEALRKRGAGRILVVNRTLEHASHLAAKWGAEVADIGGLPRALARADILIASTGAPHLVIDAQMVRSAMQQRSGRPLVLVDIAVPRDIDPAAGQVPQVRLYDIDHLQAYLERSLAQRAAEAPHVERILQEEQQDFLSYLQSLSMLPLIADLRQQAEAIRRAELEKTLRRLPDLSETERERIEAMTLALVKKLLDGPTQRLRAEAACPHAPHYATVARTLCGIDGRDGQCSFANQDGLMCGPGAD